MARRKIRSGEPSLGPLFGDGFGAARPPRCITCGWTIGSGKTCKCTLSSERSEADDGDPESYPTNGLICPECFSPQHATPGGASCRNGHGGLEGVTRDAANPDAIARTMEDLEELMWRVRARIECGFTISLDGFPPLPAAPRRTRIVWYRLGMLKEPVDRAAYRPSVRECLEYVLEFEDRRDRDGLEEVTRWHARQRARSEAELAVLIEERRSKR